MKIGSIGINDRNNPSDKGNALPVSVYAGNVADTVGAIKRRLITLNNTTTTTTIIMITIRAQTRVEIAPAALMLGLN